MKKGTSDLAEWAIFAIFFLIIALSAALLTFRDKTKKDFAEINEKIEGSCSGEN